MATTLPSSSVLASSIPLPHDPHICYALFHPSHATQDATQCIELGRRHILSLNSTSGSGAPLAESWLSSTHISSSPYIYLFRVATSNEQDSAVASLKGLSLDGLNVTESSSFRVEEIYEDPSSSSRLPRKDLRTALTHFIDAVRVRAIDDLVLASRASSSSCNSKARTVLRLNSGFVFGTSPMSSEWSAGWEGKLVARPLTYCHLHIHLTPTRLLIHPLLHSTPFLPLPLSSSLLSPSLSPPSARSTGLAQGLPISALPQLPQGTPITLLPFGTPAYFLATYKGPTSALDRQFGEALVGMGVGIATNTLHPSKSSKPSNSSNPNNPSTSTKSSPPTTETYVIAWIAVENKQGEDKGIPIIYPSRLCLSFSPSSSPSSPPLQYIPDLPAPLQPSPQVPSLQPPSAHPASSAHPNAPHANVSTPQSAISPDTLISPVQPPPSASSAHPPTNPVNLPNPHSSSHPIPRPPLSPTSSFTSSSLSLFKSLTLSRTRDVRQVASEVGGYVDAVARERERERERLKREREGNAGNGTGNTGHSRVPSAIAPSTSGSSGDGAAATTASSLATNATSQPIAQPPETTQQQSQAQAQQTFYPSPPQTVPPLSAPPDSATSPAAEVSMDVERSDPALGAAAASNPPATSASTDLPAGSSTAATATAEAGTEGVLAKTEPPQQSSSDSFDDPYNNLNTDWSSMDMDSMGFDWNMDNMDAMNSLDNMDNMDSMNSMNMDLDAAFAMAGVLPTPSSSGGAAGSTNASNANPINTITTTPLNTSFASSSTSYTPTSSYPSTSYSSTTTYNPTPYPTTYPASYPSSAYPSTNRVVSNKIDFEPDFTEDDFDFFDEPSAPPPPARPSSFNPSTTSHPFSSSSSHPHPGASTLGGTASSPPIADLSSGLTPAAGPAPLGLGMNMAMSPPSLPTPHHSHASPWTTSLSALAEAFNTPHDSIGSGLGAGGMGGMQIPPDLLPPTPGSGFGVSPEASEMPATPQGPRVEFSPSYSYSSPAWEPVWDGTPRKGSTSDPISNTRNVATGVSPPNPSIFDPIPFASSHRIADGKYASGKFAFSLLSPPEDDDMHVFDVSTTVTTTVTSATAAIDISRTTSKTRKTRSTRTSYFPVHVSPSTPAAGWKEKYNVATDPRIGVVQKLIGAKRKVVSEHRVRTGEGKMSRGWAREHEDWDSPPQSQVQDPSDDDSDASALDSDNDNDTSTPTTSPTLSRPSSPLPSYLPLGPTLLATRFQHNFLLPLSTPLRPPGAALSTAGPGGYGAGYNAYGGSGGYGGNAYGGSGYGPSSGYGGYGGNAGYAGVPTPVSPAAALGAMSEKSRSLEAAAGSVAREVVDNGVWGRAWRVGNTFYGLNSLGGGRVMWGGRGDIWAADVRAVKEIFEGVEGMEGQLGVGDIFGIESHTPASSSPFQVLEPPMLSIGKGDTVIQILPTALRFWEKLGLGPRAGKKDVTAFVFYEDAGAGPASEHKQGLVGNWLASVATLYKSKQFGEMTPGTSQMCPQDGVMPLRFDSSFRKTLTTFISLLPDTLSNSNLAFFIITPSSVMTLSSPLLRQVFSAIKKTLHLADSEYHFHILPHLVPESIILGSADVPTIREADLDTLCNSVYNRVLQPVDRAMARKFFEHGEKVRRYFEEPAYALASRVGVGSTVTYSRTSKASLDVLDRYMMLHVGYTVSPCGKWIIAACVDERGEAHDLGVWLTQTSGTTAGGEGENATEGDGIEEDVYVVRKVWEFAMLRAKRANVEWRIIIARLGAVNATELDAWTSYLSLAMKTHGSATPLHVTIISAQLSTPWTFIPPPRSVVPTISDGKQQAPPLNRASSSSTSISTASTSKTHSTTLSKSPTSSKGPTSASSRHPSQLFVDSSATTYALFPLTPPLPLFSPPTLADLGLDYGFVPEVTPRNASTSNMLPSSHTNPHTALDPDNAAMRSTSPQLEYPATSPMSINHPSPTGGTVIARAGDDFELSHPHNISDTLPLLPLASSTLIRVPSPDSPHTSSTSGIDMLWLHIMHITQTPGCSYSSRASASENPDTNINSRLLRDITLSFHALSVLAATRWRLDADAVLPFHLGAVEAMGRALEVKGDVESSE